MESNVLYFEEGRQIIMKKAYDWALNEQARLGCMAEPFGMIVNNDAMEEYDYGDCVISVFVDSSTGKALMRRDWLGDMGIKYNLLTNYDEIKKKAPKSARFMEENALKIYRYYDGANGGITRRIDRAFM